MFDPKNIGVTKTREGSTQMRPTPVFSKFLNKFHTNRSRRLVAYHVKRSFGEMTSPLEGLLAVNKPTGLSSAEALRRLQQIFKPSAIFADTLQAEKERRERESHRQRVRRRNPNAVRNEVKIGHGGTLDPMASGVLIAGIGGGTKYLQQFLNCTKTYEATAMFGADTDTYDAMGKVVKWASWEGINGEKVEKALEQFKGDIMQVPPM
jgi:tRNA pseudouridine55 synthase